MPSSHSSEAQSGPLAASENHKTGTWKCTKCGETLEQSFDTPQQCSTSKDVSLPSPPAAPSSQPGPHLSEARLRSDLISISSTTLVCLFFVPWVQIIGVSISGLTLQRHSDNYQLVWVIPSFAFATLGLNLIQFDSNFIRRLAGAAPLALFALALTRLGSDLIAMMTPAAWIGLTAGTILVLLPGKSKKSNPR